MGRTAHRKWKNITDRIYSGELTPEKGVDLLIDLLAENQIRTRANGNVLLGASFFVYDKSEWKFKEEKPLGLGLIYRKPNGIKTQDIFFVAPDEEIESYYSEKDMVKKYPHMKGVHKDILPL